MAQVDVIQFAKITPGSGQPFAIGSKVLPSTITLNGTGQVIHRVYNDIPATTAQVLMDNEFVAEWPLFWAIKSSTAGTVAWGNDANNAQCIGLVANVWQFFESGRATTNNTSDVEDRSSASLSTIGDIVYYNRAAGVADVDFVAVC